MTPELWVVLGEGMAAGHIAQVRSGRPRRERSGRGKAPLEVARLEHLAAAAGWLELAAAARCELLSAGEPVREPFTDP